MIHVVAIITAKPGMREAILKEFHAKFGPDTLVVIEKWESPEALKAHATSPHMAAYAAKTRDMIANRTIHVLQPG
jgi:quinol monooxygenase YgiN